MSKLFVLTTSAASFPYIYIGFVRINIYHSLSLEGSPALPPSPVGVPPPTSGTDPFLF
ncbi:hypothetical protein L209DRAFT_747113 [Thermothelomyces heterothallicus CBS 203.75]